jgi:hypothetical protein
MSIFVWRVWQYSPSQDNNILLGMHDMPWIPQKVEQAFCIGNSRVVHVTGQKFKSQQIRISMMNWINWIDNPSSIYEHDDEPSVDCTCGIYGFKGAYLPTEYSPIEPALSSYSPGSYNEVLGIAEIWGKIIVAEYGYRAQFAKICALIDSPTSIATDYGIPNLPTVEYAQKEFFS